MSPYEWKHTEPHAGPVLALCCPHAVLDQFCFHGGPVLVLCWFHPVLMLVICWSCAGSMLALLWAALAPCWPCADPVLAPRSDSASQTVRLGWLWVANQKTMKQVKDAGLNGS